MKGWSAFSKPEAKSPLTDPTNKIKKKYQPTGSEILAEMEVPIEGTEDYQGMPDTEDRFTDEEIAAGAGASGDFYGKESGGHRTKIELGTGTVPGKTHWSGKIGDVVGIGKDRKVLTIDKTTGKPKKAKNVAKKNILTGNLSIPLDTLYQKDLKTDKRGRDAEKETGEYVWDGGTASDDVLWSFEGPMDDNIADKDLKDRKRRAKLNTKTGVIEEQYRTTLGTWRSTGRTLNDGAPDPAYVDAAQQNIQDEATKKVNDELIKVNKEADDEKKKLDKEAQKKAANEARERGESSYMWNGVEYHFDWRSRQ